MPDDREISTADLDQRISGLPGFARIRAAADRAGAPAWLVGGSVRDALLGRPVDNLDLVVEDDPAAILAALGGEAVTHDRFRTATVELDGASVDVACARAETYAQPGALPEVRPAGLPDDLRRRDFSVNAMAVGLSAPGELVDPLGGLEDLRARRLRILHEGSFVDDPTRALRAARYASRLGLRPDAGTLELLRTTDLTTVSRDRVDAELRRLARDERPRAGFELLDEWGIRPLPPGAAELIDGATEVLDRPAWAAVAPRAEVVLAAARGAATEVRELAAVRPDSPSAAVAAAAAFSGPDLVLARALGATWLDRYVEEWREVTLEISGTDLIEAGVAEGPAVGRGLEAALQAKLDGATRGPDDELRIALEAAGS